MPLVELRSLALIFGDLCMTFRSAADAFCGPCGCEQAWMLLRFGWCCDQLKRVMTGLQLSDHMPDFNSLFFSALSYCGRRIFNLFLNSCSSNSRVWCSQHKAMGSIPRECINWWKAWMQCKHCLLRFNVMKSLIIILGPLGSCVCVCVCVLWHLWWMLKCLLQH